MADMTSVLMGVFNSTFRSKTFDIVSQSAQKQLLKTEQDMSTHIF